MKRHPRNPPRLLVMLLLLLTGGALVNVAVAWGCAAWYPTVALRLEEARWNRESLAVWESSALVNWPTPAIVERHNFGYGGDPPGAVMIAYENDPFSESRSQLTRTMSIMWEDYGWPSLSLRAAEWREGYAIGIGENIVKKTYLPVDRPFDRYRPVGRLPTWPTWPGFAINTMFYAAILWGVFAAPFALRRRLRIKRGLCPACAYPVGTNEVCTECGRAVALGGKR